MSKLGISTGITPNDGTGDTLLGGAVKINSNFNEIYSYFGDGTNLTFTGGGVSSQWVTTGAGIHTLSNVGIGTTNPRFKLEVGAVGASGTSLYVNGDARVTGILTVGTASITLNGISNIINVGTGITINGSTGIISATSIVLGGTTLTGSAVTSITAGSGISVDQSTGNVTITATGGGGSSQWVTTAAGIHTLSNVGIGTTNPTSALTVKGNTSLETLSVSGISTFNNNVRVSGIVTANSVLVSDDGGNAGSVLIQDAGGYSRILFRETNGTDGAQIQGVEANLYVYPGSGGYIALNGSNNNIFLDNGDVILNDNGGTTHAANGLMVTGLTSTTSLNVSGVSTFAGITTVTGSTLFSKQLNVSGVSTFAGASKFNGTIDINVGSATGILFDSGSYTGANTPFKMWIGNQDANARYFTINQSNGGQVIMDNTHTTGMNDQRASSHSFSHPTLGYYALFHPSVGSGGVSLYHPSSAGGILDQKFETTSSGVAIVGVVTAISGIVTYYGDTSNATDGRWTLGANGTSDYTFTGIGFTQTTNDPVLYLARGRVYEFVNNSGGSHPFQIRVSDGGAAYSDGVTNNAAATGVIRFQIPFNAPNTLYYQCTSHSGMGNTISVYPTTI